MPDRELDPQRVDLLKRLEAVRIIASTDPEDEKAARRALEAVEVIAGDCIRAIERPGG